MDRRRITFSAGFCLMLALMLMLVPVSWLAAMIVAAMIHEGCHYAAIMLMTGKRGSLGLLSYGAKITLPDMEPWKEAVCALAGPVGGLILLPFASVFPKLALCAFAQSVYNLIPIYPMDGGRACKCMLSSVLTPPAVKKVMQVVANVLRLIFVAGGMYYCFVLRLGVLPLLFSILICFRTK